MCRWCVTAGGSITSVCSECIARPNRLLRAAAWTRDDPRAEDIGQDVAERPQSCTAQWAELGVTSDDQVQGKVGDVTEPFSLDHGRYHFSGIVETELLDRILEFR